MSADPEERLLAPHAHHPRSLGDPEGESARLAMDGIRRATPLARTSREPGLEFAAGVRLAEGRTTRALTQLVPGDVEQPGQEEVPSPSSVQPWARGGRAGSGPGCPAGPRTPGPGCPTARAGQQSPTPSGRPARPSRSGPRPRRGDGGSSTPGALIAVAVAVPDHPDLAIGIQRPPPHPTHTGVPRQPGWLRPISSATMSSGLSYPTPAHSGGPSRTRPTASHDGTAAHPQPWWAGPDPGRRDNGVPVSGQLLGGTRCR